jgi:DNA-binding winged helix-turn-helix (wHTH) protein/tetratricopeptide (TPR) repeat protein
VIYRFGPFEADRARYALRRDGELVEIEPQVFDLLLVLLAERRLLSKEELVERVWSGRFVTDAAVSRAIQKARRALGDDAHSPRWIETVHGRGYRFVGEVELGEAPAAEGRVPSARPAATPVAAGSGAGSPPTRRRWAIWSLLAILVAAAVAIVRLAEPGGARPPAPPELANPVAVRPSLLVLDFGELSGRDDQRWLGTAAAELLAGELTADGRWRIVPREEAGVLLRDLSLPPQTSLAPATLAALRSRTGAATVITGAVLSAAGGLRIQTALYDAVTGEAIGSFSTDASAEALAAASSELAAQIRARLVGSAALPRPEPIAPALPTEAGAARLYAEALAELRRDETREAISRLERLVVDDPEFAAGHLQLARAYRDLGDERRAREAARRGAALAAGLPQRQRLELEGLGAALAGDWIGATQAYTALWKFHPDELDYGLELAAAQLASGAAPQAAATVEALRRLPEPLRSEPRVALTAARVAGARGEPLRQQELAAAAAGRAVALGSRRLQAQARLEEGAAWRQAGEPARARAAYESARALFAQTGDDNGVAVAVQRVAAVLYHQGELDAAETRFREAMESFERLGRVAPAAVCRMNLGILAENRGQHAAAERDLLAARRVLEASGDRENARRALYNLISLRYGQGDADGARRYAEEGLAAALADGDRVGQAEFRFRLGEVEILRGRLPEAASLLDQALAVFREVDAKRSQASTLNALGSIRSREGRLGEAARLTGEALERFREIDDAYGVADALNRTANSRFEQGRIAEAADLHRQSLAAYERIEHRLGVGVASYGLALDLLAGGEVALAASAAARARDVFDELRSDPFGAAARVALAEIEAARGELDRASGHLADAAARLGDPPLGEIARALRRVSARVAIEDGDAVGAERIAREALARDETSPPESDQIALRELLARALLEQGRLDAARAEIDRTLRVLAGSDREPLRLAAETTAARVDAGLGEREPALRRLLAVASRARELGLVERQLEAELARAELLARAGELAAARSIAAEVEPAAAAAGYAALERRARRQPG